MRIAVTGATGFLGRHVLAELDRLGVAATLITRPTSSSPALDGPHVQVPIDLSLADAATFKAIGEPDVLIHLAWSGLPNYRSLHHFESELPTQFKFLKALVVGGLQNLLVTGTCLEYGMQSG